MNSSPIDPIFIPHFTGDIGALEKDVAALAKDASDIRTTGADTHSTFQGLSSCYVAPEAKQLLDSTLPVSQRADQFADNLEKVKSALSEYATEIRPIVKELDQLREQAVAFRAEIGDSDRWLKDQGKVDRNKHLIQAVAVAQEKFHAAERTAFNKITGLFDKSLQLTVDDGTHKKGMYGYKPSDAGKAEKTPWGTVEGRDYDGLEAVWHWTSDNATGLVKGFFVDGVGAAAKGLFTLANFTDSEKCEEAWRNLGTVAHGIGLYATKPFDMVFDQTMLRDKDSADQIRAKKAAQEFGKSFVAWDQWQKNPGRAFGATAFNVVTLASGPLTKAGMAGRTGAAGTAAGEASAAARAAAAIGKVGLYSDPGTYVWKATGLGVNATKTAIPKIGDLVSELKPSLGRTSDHTPTSLKYDAADGTTRYLDIDGTIRNAKEVEQPGSQARKEPSKHDLPNVKPEDVAPVRKHEKVLEGAGGPSRVENVAGHPSSAHPGDGTHPTGGHAADHPTGGGSGSRTPSGGGHGTPAHSGHNTPGTGSGHGGHDTGGHGVHDADGAHAQEASGPSDHAADSGGAHGSDTPSPHGHDGSGQGGRGNGPQGVQLDPQPGWHGESAGKMRHYRLPAESVRHLSPAEQVAALEQRTVQLADEALQKPLTEAEKKAKAKQNQPDPGENKLVEACAGSLLHDNVITSHTSMTKMNGQAMPDTHPVLKGLLDRIKAQSDAGVIPPTGSGHGKCAEIALINDRIKMLENNGVQIRTLDDAKRELEGAKIHTRKIGDFVSRKTGEVMQRHGDYLPPCGTCTHILPELEILPV